MFKPIKAQKRRPKGRRKSRARARRRFECSASILPPSGRAPFVGQRAHDAQSPSARCAQADSARSTNCPRRMLLGRGAFGSRQARRLQCAAGRCHLPDPRRPTPPRVPRRTLGRPPSPPRASRLCAVVTIRAIRLTRPNLEAGPYGDRFRRERRSPSRGRRRLPAHSKNPVQHCSCFKPKQRWPR